MNERIDQSPPFQEFLAPEAELPEGPLELPEVAFEQVDPLGPTDPLPALPPLLEYANYADASDSSLRRAELHELSQFLTADLGHFILKGLVVASQIIALLRGEDVTLSWDPDVRGISPHLDEKKDHANEQLQAIWREQSLRRSVRQDLRTH